jgi:hypothetical protein
LALRKIIEAKKSVYIESTIPSYAVARPSSNILNTIRKSQTEMFWQMRERFTLWISQDILDEIGQGDQDATQRRLEFVKGIELLPEPEGLDTLADTYQTLLCAYRNRAKQDCFHLA